jgi:hypothetical protein
MGSNSTTFLLKGVIDRVLLRVRCLWREDELCSDCGDQRWIR